MKRLKKKRVTTPAEPRARRKSTRGSPPPQTEAVEVVSEPVDVAAPAVAQLSPPAESPNRYIDDSGFGAGIFDDAPPPMYLPGETNAQSVSVMPYTNEAEADEVLMDTTRSAPMQAPARPHHSPPVVSKSRDERDTFAAPPLDRESDGPLSDVVGERPDAGSEEAGAERRGGRRRRPRGGRRTRRRESAIDDRVPMGEDTTTTTGPDVAADSVADREPRRPGAWLEEVADSEEVDEEIDEADGRAAKEVDPVRREMLINVSEPDEVRIAMLADGRLDELYIERAANISNVGNIYKGRVMNVEGSIQAAFVDFGKPVHGFLHISDLHPKYFSASKSDTELVGRKMPRRHRPPIQGCLRRGQEVIVQVIKEGVGTKGPTLSTYISLPGRFLVMMPGMEQLGVSRKIEDEEQRRKLRDLLSELTLPKDMGFIVRTAGMERTKRDLQRDLSYLLRLWEKVEARIKTEPAPATLYKESDLVIRTIRDVFDSNFERIVVDNPQVAARVREFLRVASPKARDVVELYDNAEPLFYRHGIEREIEKLHSRQVPLACGGSIVIEPTEALVAIDVNSGKFRVPDAAEETAYRVNMEAADEIARQLRLRDLGGLIICDFIDMVYEKHRRAVERRLSDALRKHKERAKLLRISKFGILEMTRQRQRPSFAKSIFQDCPRCSGTGRLKATESVALDVMREIRLASQREGVISIDVRISTTVANDILNRKRHQLTDLERTTGQTIRIHGDPALGADEVRVSCTDRRGREVVAGMGSEGSAAPVNRPSDPAGAPQAAGPARGEPRPGGNRRGGRSRRRRRGPAA